MKANVFAVVSLGLVSCGDRGAVPGADASRDGITPISDAANFDGRIVSEQTTCHLLKTIGPPVTPTFVGTDVPAPALQGGTIVDGIYNLVALQVSAPPPQDIAPRYRTVQFATGATVWRIVDLAPVVTVPGDWSIVRPTLSVTTQANMLAVQSEPCYDVTFSSLYLYEASPDAVTMWFESGRALFSYVRVP